VPASGASLEDAAIVQADLASLVTLLPRLTAEQREAVALRLAGLPPAEIADVLGKSRGAVDMTLHRALTRLRALMTSQSQPMTGDGGRD
jgi:RNA polymerase sigma factor (sigma-70 family)